MYLTHTGLLFTVKLFCNLSFTSVYSTSFGGAMCLVEHTHNGGTPLWSVGS